MTRAIVLLMAVACLPVTAGAVERKTLAECIALALAQQPTLRAADASVIAARERVWQSTAAYLPQVSGNYSASRRRSPNGSTSTGDGSVTVGGGNGGTNRSFAVKREFSFYSAGVSLSQVLFDFGQNLALIHRAQELEASIAADADTQRDAVVFDVSQAYFGLLAAYRLRNVADETVRQNKQHLEVAQGRYDVGFAPRFDVTAAQVQLANAELTQVTARNNVTLGRATLRHAVGLSGPLDFDIVDVLDAPPVAIDEETAVQRAYDNRPELRSNLAQQRAATKQIVALQKDYLPRVGGAATYTKSGREDPSDESWNVGAQVNLNVFNGGLTTAQIGEARANLAVLEADHEAIRQNVALEVRQALANVEQGAESIRVAEKGSRQARENLELAEGRYSTGAGSIIELTDAQASLASADANRVQALVNYRIAVATLERATAQPLDRMP
jgi:outer membrane protein TolC